jgi:integrase
MTSIARLLSSKHDMTKIELKGIAKVTSKGRDYWYAWRGGPRLRGKPGTPSFMASYNDAITARRIPEPGRFRSLVTLYRGSTTFQSLAASTRRNWSPWLDRIDEYFGDLRIAVFEHPEKIRPLIRDWRDRYAKTPRSADYGLQVLSRVLSYAVDPLSKIASNPCEGIRHLYSADRSDIIWTEADIARLKAASSPEIAHAVDLAAHTGLRLGDLLRLSWSHVVENEDWIAITTGKSKHRRQAIIPLYDDLKKVLAAIPKRSPTILTSSKSRPWTKDGFGSSFIKAKAAAGMADTDLHFHDLRGTAATRFYTANLPERVIAEMMGWEEEHVARIVRRYVGRNAATLAFIGKLNKGGT